MPKVSYAEQIQDWEKLLVHARAHGADLPGLDAVLDELAAIRKRYEELHTRRRNLRAESLVISREIETVREDGKEKAGRARNFLRSKLGFRGEELVLYNMRPRRKYKKRKKAKKESAGNGPRSRAAKRS